MKTFARILVAPSITIVIIALAACSGDDTPAAPVDAGTKRPDAAPLPIPDASPAEPDTAAPPSTVLTSGEGYSLVYSSATLVGIGNRTDVQAFFDAKGGLTEYYFSDNETLTHGVTTIAEVGGDTIAGWGVWREGPTVGKHPAKVDGRFSFPPGSDFHYAVGKKSLSAAWPAMTKTYALAGGTPPTADGVAEPGTLTAATATCDLGPARTCTITINAGAGGGTLAINLTSAKIDTLSTGAARVQVGDAKGGVEATFAGDGAERIILIFGGLLEGGTSAGKNLRGAAVLKAP